jgi:endo-1,4-beta-xylanase
MKSNYLPTILALTALLSGAAANRSGAGPMTLKDAYKNDFLIGVAINRTIATGTPIRANNANRSQEQVEKDIAVVKEQFNQISPENDLKWEVIQPREGTDGYDFGPADAYVNFGLSNHLYIVGHTLVWHSQTPSWVFAGTNQPPAVTDGSLGRGFGYGGPRASREELLQRMHDHITTVVGR